MRVITTISILSFSAFLFAQTGQPLFQLLAPEQSNIYFENTITDEKDHNILIYSNYYGGAGVGIGDFNRDGLADIFFAGNLVADQLYLNQGNLTFENSTEAVGINNNGGWSSGVLVADINNDGWQDIYITRELYDKKAELRRNLLYINNGFSTMADGKKAISFSEKAADYGLDDSERSRHATFIDYNKDGLLDLFVLNQPPNPGNYSSYYGSSLLVEKWAPRLYQNKGNQSFIDVTKAAGVGQAGYGNSVIAADVNGDGWQDLYVANDYEAPDFLYLNRGDGTFENVIHQSMRHISYYAMGVDAADINNDGHLDVMTLDMVAEDNFRLKANMGGMYPEAFWKIVEQGGHHQYMFNALHLNNGNHTFSDIAQLAGLSNTDWSWANLIADFDNDGWKDVFITNGLLRDIRNSDSAKSFPQLVQQQIQEFIAAHPNAGDVDIFEVLDLDKVLASIPSVPLKNYIYRNNGDLTFSKKTEEWGFQQPTFSNGAAYADLDNDGDLDLVVNNINEVAYVYENKSDDNWLRIKVLDTEKQSPILGTKITLTTEQGSQFVELTNVRGMYSTSENIAHFGLNKQSQVISIRIVFPDQTEATLSNIAANQLVEIDKKKYKQKVKTSEKVEPYFNNSTSEIGWKHYHRENDFNDYDKQVLLPHKMSQMGPALAIGDWTGDGLEDVFVGAATGLVGQLYQQDNKGQFKPISMAALEEDVICEDVDATFLDVEGDGDLDLYVVSGGNEFRPQAPEYQDRLYLNNGQGQFTKATQNLPRFRESGAFVRPQDFDGDGDLDLLIGGRHNPWDYPSPAVSRLLRNEEGSFTDLTKTHAKDLIFLGLATDAVWTDFDGDQDFDFIVVGEWMPPTIFENKDNYFKALEVWPSIDAPLKGWWYSIAAEDLDGDGDEDYLLGNLGLNYKYKATTAEPFEVYYDDFDQNGQKDIVLSYYNFGEQYPLRGRSCSSQQIPDLKKQFPTYDIFAAANLKSVYSEEKLDKALHYATTNFASGYIENQGGKFAFKAFPNAAQVSSINDFYIKDVNVDGFKDIVIAGNLYPAEIETPRNDAGIGLLMLGDGHGNWQPLSATESGINLPFEVKKIKPISIKNKEYLIIGVNDGPLQILSR